MRTIRLCLVIMLGSVAVDVSASEHPIAMKDLPAAVQATIRAETFGSAIRGLSRETDLGMTVYEVETVKNGLSRDLLIDKEGVIVEIEEQIALTAAPTAVQQALSRQGHLLKLERVTGRSATTYEAHIQRASKKQTVTLDSNGLVVAPK